MYFPKHFLLYFFIFCLAPQIAKFYNEPLITDLLRVVCISILFHSLSVVPKVILARDLNFNLQLQIKLPAAIISSILAIVFAYFGYGVWALIIQITSNSLLVAVFLFLKGFWKPDLTFSILSLKKYFQFSLFIFLDRIIEIPYRNMYLIVIPKLFSASIVGLYYFADRLNQALVPMIYRAFVNVSYPALSKIRNQKMN